MARRSRLQLAVCTRDAIDGSIDIGVAKDNGESGRVGVVGACGRESRILRLKCPCPRIAPGRLALLTSLPLGHFGCIVSRGQRAAARRGQC